MGATRPRPEPVPIPRPVDPFASIVNGDMLLETTAEREARETAQAERRTEQ